MTTPNGSGSCGRCNFLHSVFEFAIKKQWATFNPVRVIDRPGNHSDDDEVRLLIVEELEALLRAVPDDAIGATDRALYLTAAMTGLRQGELAALRWSDVDFAARKIRVQRSFSRSDVGTPKSRRSRRLVPMVERVAQELAPPHPVPTGHSISRTLVGHSRGGR